MLFASIMLIASLTALSCTVPIQGAPRHYCPNGKQLLQFSKDAISSTFDAEFIPGFLVQPDDRNILKCVWEIEFGLKELKNRQLILIGEAYQADSEGQVERRNRTELMFGWGKADVSVTSGLFHVYSLNASQALVVESSWNPSTHSSSRFKLRLLIPPAGNCTAASMFSFRGNCYNVTVARQSADAALSSTGGRAQLASFSSKAELNDFVIFNADFLNLYKPVRIGMFYRPTDATLLALDWSDEGRCRLRQISMDGVVDRSWPANRTGCASLRVDPSSKRAVIKLSDCRDSMPSLLSFPRDARSQGRPAAASVCEWRDLEAELARQPEAKRGFKKGSRAISVLFKSSNNVVKINERDWLLTICVACFGYYGLRRYSIY